MSNPISKEELEEIFVKFDAELEKQRKALGWIVSLPENESKDMVIGCLQHNIMLVENHYKDAKTLYQEGEVKVT